MGSHTPPPPHPHSAVNSSFRLCIYLSQHNSRRLCLDELWTANCTAERPPARTPSVGRHAVNYFASTPQSDATTVFVRGYNEMLGATVGIAPPGLSAPAALHSLRCIVLHMCSYGSHPLHAAWTGIFERCMLQWRSGHTAMRLVTHKTFGVAQQAVDMQLNLAFSAVGRVVSALVQQRQRHQVANTCRRSLTLSDFLLPGHRHGAAGDVQRGGARSGGAPGDRSCDQPAAALRLRAARLPGGQGGF